MKRGLRGHDGAVHEIAFDLALAAAAYHGNIAPGLFERKPCLFWAVPTMVWGVEITRRA